MKNQLTISNVISSFESDSVRRVFHNDQWWFAIADVCGILADTTHGKKYWNKIKNRDPELFKIQLSPIWGQLKIMSLDGKRYETECANIEGILRIIQSIPSPKAEPFKAWLAKVGNERIEENADPSKSIERAMERYRSLGKSEDFIKERIKGIVTRKGLTSDWQYRGISDGRNYARLTNDIHQQAFDMTTDEHKDIKGLKSQNLRDSMSELELAVINIGELATRTLHKQNDSYGLQELRDDAIKGGRVAGDLRRNMEKAIGRSVISSTNYLNG